MAPDGTLYLLDDVLSSYCEIYKSENQGLTWSLAGRLYGNSTYGDGKDVAFAVSDDESTFAVIRVNVSGDPCDATTKMGLYVSTDGYTWDKTWLSGAYYQVPDVDFDSDGNLYVCYYDLHNDQLVMLTDAPAVPADDPIYDDAAITFTRSDVIAPAGTGTGHLAIDVYDVGGVDIAWRATTGATRYSNFDGSSVSTDSTSLGYTHGIMGISRDAGTVRIGLNLGKNVYQQTRTGVDTWAATDTGFDLEDYASPSGGFDVDPTTGQGGFIFNWIDPCDSTMKTVYLAEDGGGTWNPAVLEPYVSHSAYGRDATLIYDADGTPYGSYNNADGSSTGIYGGEIDGAGRLGYVTNAYSYFHNDMTRADDGTLYLLNQRHSSQSQLFVSDTGGLCWTQIGPNFGAANHGDSLDAAIAVAPDESLIACLMNRSDGTNGLALYTTIDWGTTWEKQWLPGSYAQIADLGFDADGNLYVCYYNSVNTEIILLSTLPQDKPACWNATQCYGDSDGSGEVTTADWPAFRDSFGADYPEVDYNPCADYDRDGDVDTADWPAFRANFGAGSVATDCPLASTWPPLP